MRDSLMERLSNLGEELFDAVRDVLIEKAKRRGTIYYGDIARRLGIGSLGLDPLLERICRGEGGTMLSVVVISERRGKPGGGFFRLAKKLGRYSGTTDADAAAFYAEELRRVYEHWGN